MFVIPSNVFSVESELKRRKAILSSLFLLPISSWKKEDNRAKKLINSKIK
jgi:hypothetical protein